MVRAEDADKLAKLLKGVKCKVNLIHYSPIEKIPYQSPDRKDVLKFREILDRAGVPATIRISKGIDISAACGQLRIGHTQQQAVALRKPLRGVHWLANARHDIQGHV